MSRPYELLPPHAPVLVSRHNLGHRPHGDRAACSATDEMVRATAIQCRAWSVLPCPTCWGGRRPW